MSRQPAYAAAILEGIYEVDPTVRLELEIARAHYFAEEYDQSRTWFIGILDKEIPNAVRDNVEDFLRRIHSETNPLTFSVNALVDDNPMATTSAQTVSLFGIFDAPYEAKYEINRETGIEARLAYDKRAFDRIGYGFNLNHTQFQSDDFQRGNFFPYVSYAGLFTPRLNTRIGYISETYGGESLRDGYQLDVDYFLGRFFNFRTSMNLHYEDSQYVGRPFLDGDSQRISLQASRWLSVDSNISLMYADLRNSSMDSQFAYSGDLYQVTFLRTGLPSELELRLTYNLGHRDYVGFSPITPVIRNDKTATLNIVLKKKDFIVWGVRPYLRFTIQENESTLNIVSYKKNYISINFERLF